MVLSNRNSTLAQRQQMLSLKTGIILAKRAYAAALKAGDLDAADLQGLYVDGYRDQLDELRQLIARQ